MAGIKKSLGVCLDCQTQCDMVGIECKEKLLYSKKPLPLCQYHYHNRQVAKQQSKKGIFKIRDDIKKAKDIPPMKKRGPNKPHSYCFTVNEKGEIKKADPIKYKKPRKPTGEKEIFKQIWEEREHICINCKVYLGEEPIVHFFSHAKGKGAHPELRLDKGNIDILCRDCHYARDFQGKEKFKGRTK